MFKRILCATDGSEHGDRALRQAARMVRAGDGELHVAHVIERIPGGGRLGGQNVFLTEFEIDSRPSDALALAVRSGAPIFAADEVIAESAIEFEHEVEDTEEVVEKFKDFLDSVKPDDFLGE